jgi:hypothetical protein
MATATQRIAKEVPLRGTLLDERRALLQRILWSRSVEKSVRIREFLNYVCDRALLEPSAEIHEQDRLNFHFNYNQEGHYAYFENRQPRLGELEAYRGDASASYCHLAFFPNLGGTGNLLMIAGTEFEGTEAGSEFVTSERSLAQLRALVKPLPDGRLPYFEVLLKGTRVGGATPAFSIVSIRSPRL